MTYWIYSITCGWKWHPSIVNAVYMQVYPVVRNRACSNRYNWQRSNCKPWCAGEHWPHMTSAHQILKRDWSRRNVNICNSQSQRVRQQCGRKGVSDVTQRVIGCAAWHLNARLYQENLINNKTNVNWIVLNSFSNCSFLTFLNKLNYTFLTIMFSLPISCNFIPPMAQF